MPYGFNGRILRVDLTSCTTSVEEHDEAFYRRYLGGGLMGAYFLMHDMEPGADPLGADNMLVVAPSVVTGAPVPGLSRYSVVAKSPLSGGIGESQAGGFFGPELKRAGYDAIVIRGMTTSPVYLFIHDRQVELRDARSLVGLETFDADKRLKDEVGDRRIRVLQTGPAGERLSRLAGICSDVRFFNARGGLGAVMGSKGLRAIAVRGSGSIKVAERDRLLRLTKWFMENFMKNPASRSHHELGTPGIILGLNEAGMLPTRNFQTTFFEEADKISGPAIHELMFKGREGCYACPVRCKQIVGYSGHPDVAPEYGAPEYETCAALGSYLGVSDPVVVARGNQRCNAYGLDTISTGGTIAFAMECFERGILTLRDTSGLELRFGNGEAALELIEMIGQRTGIGDLLAEGSARAAQVIGNGAEGYVMASKGREFPAHTPRMKQSLALAYSSLPIGADHMSHFQETFVTPQAPDYLADRLKPYGITARMDLSALDAQKVRYYWYTQMANSIREALTMCHFCFAPIGCYSADQTVEIVSAVTGWDTNLWELMKAGERRITLLRAFNSREGFRRTDDLLPERMYEPIISGPGKGKHICRDKFEEALTTLYIMSGWDEADGIPLRVKLEELDLDWVVGRLFP